MYCKNCGKELKDGTKFCNGCGKPAAQADGAVITSAPSVKLNMAKPKKNLKIIIAVAAVILIGVAIFTIKYFSDVAAEKTAIEEMYTDYTSMFNSGDWLSASQYTVPGSEPEVALGKGNDLVSMVAGLTSLINMSDGLREIVDGVLASLGDGADAMVGMLQSSIIQVSYTDIEIELDMGSKTAVVTGTEINDFDLLGFYKKQDIAAFTHTLVKDEASGQWQISSMQSY